MKKISSDKAPKADHILSQAVESNGFVFVSGQIHSDASGAVVNGTTQEKLALIFQNISSILEAADLSLDNIVKVSIYVTDMAQMPDINASYASYFKGSLPAREAIGVAALPLGATIEISVIAER